MEQRNDGLWKGGPWEQPSPVFPAPPAVRIPSQAMTPNREVLRRRKHRRRWPWFLSILLIVAALCALTYYLSLRFPGASFRTGPSIGPEQFWQEEEREYSSDPPSIPRADTGTGVSVTLEPPTGGTLSFAQIYEKNIPSMVSIRCANVDGYSSGTGIVLTQDGYIITNAHVVAGSDQVRVSLSDERVLAAALVGFDADEDIAVLKIEAQGLIPAEFGDSMALKCGEPVAALGDPLGYRSTITDGIISALDREVDVEGTTMVLIQTTAAINFGNSGGALINQYGQVVGITTVKIVSDDGSVEALGFAIPSRRVKYVADTLIAGEEIRTGVFGFTVNIVPVEEGGLELLEVDPRSDAWTKGLQAGDVIVAVNGIEITGTQDLTRFKQALGPGDPVEVTCRRDRELFTVQVLLVDSDLIT